MKVNIHITGGIMGNSILESKLWHNRTDSIKMCFGGFLLKFDTKKDAYNCLKLAFNILKDEEYEYYKNGGITYYSKSRLTYDASIARIQEV